MFGAKRVFDFGYEDYGVIFALAFGAQGQTVSARPNASGYMLSDEFVRAES